MMKKTIRAVRCGLLGICFDFGRLQQKRTIQPHPRRR